MELILDEIQINNELIEQGLLYSVNQVVCKSLQSLQRVRF